MSLHWIELPETDCVGKYCGEYFSPANLRLVTVVSSGKGRGQTVESLKSDKIMRLSEILLSFQEWPNLSIEYLINLRNFISEVMCLILVLKMIAQLSGWSRKGLNTVLGFIGLNVNDMVWNVIFEAATEMQTISILSAMKWVWNKRSVI